MRRRLIALVLGTTLLAVVLLGTLLVVVLWRDQLSNAQERAADTARRAAAGIEDGIESDRSLTPVQLQSYARDGSVLVVEIADGPTVASDTLPTGATISETATDGDVTATVLIPREVVVSRVLNQTVLVVVISVVVLVVSLTLAWFYARRLTRPLEDFAEQAERISTGDARALGRRYGVPELDAVAEVLDRGVTGFTQVLEDERRVTDEQSHQLRTPLTAMSLRLDAVLTAEDLDEARVEAEAALEQVSRLAGVIDEVVAVRRGLSIAPRTRVRLDDLVAEAVREWTPTFASSGRAVVAGPPSGLEVEAVRGAQAQALATLVENSWVHGAGTTSLRVRATGTWAVVEVTDQGPGVAPEVESRVFERHVSGAGSSGLGLALARTLVVADGGRLEMISARPAVFAVFLPALGPGDGDREADDLDGA